MTKVSLAWDLCWFQLLIELHWCQTTSGDVESWVCIALIYHSSRCRSCKSELPFPFNWGNGFAAGFLVGKSLCLQSDGMQRQKIAQNSPCVAVGGQEVLWWVQNVPTAGSSRCAIPDVQCGPFPIFASVLWEMKWWNRFEDKGSPGAWGWDLADFRFWCLLHETYPSLFIFLDSCMTMYMHVHHTRNMHVHSHPH